MVSFQPSRGECGTEHDVEHQASTPCVRQHACPEDHLLCLSLRVIREKHLLPYREGWQIVGHKSFQRAAPLSTANPSCPAITPESIADSTPTPGYAQSRGPHRDNRPPPR